MTLIVEDGSIVAGATSFSAVSDADAYCSARGYAAWAALNTTQKEQYLTLAGMYLRDEALFKYRGMRKQYDQPMPWPRTGASIYRGPAIPDTAIPPCLKDANCELAYKAISGDLQPDLEHGGGVQSERIGPIATSYFPNYDPRTLIVSVMGILKPILLTTDIMGLVPDVYHSDSSSLGDDYPFGVTDFRTPGVVPDPTLDES